MIDALRAGLCRGTGVLPVIAKHYGQDARATLSSCIHHRFSAPHPDDAISEWAAASSKLVAREQVGHRRHAPASRRPFGRKRSARRKKPAAAKGARRRARAGRVENPEVVHDLRRGTRPPAASVSSSADWSFVPFRLMPHPDHVRPPRSARNARFVAKLTRSEIPGEPYYPKRIIYYSARHLRLNFTPNFCIDISDTIEKRSRASGAIRRSSSATAWASRAWSDDLANFGTPHRHAHAEPFFTHELLGFGGWINWFRRLGRR